VSNISITRYVDITSGVGGANPVPRRDLILREVTQNPLVPAGAVVVFNSPEAAGTFFGEATDEYKVAVKYFGFVSKQITAPTKMSFIRWNPADTAPAIYGSPVASLSALKLFDAGALYLRVDGVLVTVVGIDVDSVTSFADVASAVQTKLRASANPQLADCTVVYETNRGVFILTGSVATVGAEITAERGGLNDMSLALGWSTGLQVNAPGTKAATAREAISISAGDDDNFGSFGYCGTVIPNAAEINAIAEWNHTQNNKFVYCVGALASEAALLFAENKGNSGMAMTLIPGDASLSDHAEICPAEIFASTNYLRPAASQNYMYYQFDNRLPTVTDDAAADTFDALRANYIGRTQTGGQKLAFFQRGVLMGGSQAAVDLTAYTGEVWLKDALLSTIMGGFLALPSMPATSEGRIILLSLMQGPFDQALDNGVFSPGKALTDVQKAYITQVTGDNEAWRQVQSKGYWVDATIVSNVVNGITVYSAAYVLLYGKNDQIRKVTGSDILI
jgi:hypothetical protein